MNEVGALLEAYLEGKTEILGAEPDIERGKQKYTGQNLILRGENRNTRGRT